MVSEHQQHTVRSILNSTGQSSKCVHLHTQTSKFSKLEDLVSEAFAAVTLIRLEEGDHYVVPQIGVQVISGQTSVRQETQLISCL